MVTLCGEQLMQPECELTSHLFFNAEYACGWCIALKCKSVCNRGYSSKTEFFKVFNQLGRKPGFESTVYQKLKNLMFNPIVPDDYLTLCKSPDNIENCQNFCFTLFDV